MPDWTPTPDAGRVRIGLGRAQKLRWAALTAVVAGIAGAAGILAGNAALVVLVGAMAAASLAYARGAGIELAPTTVTVVCPSLRRRTRWTRTVRWTTVTDIRATGTGEIWMALPGEPPLVLRAPRGRWLGADPDFDEKLRLIETWWRVNSLASLRETSSTPFERVRAALEGREHEWQDWQQWPPGEVEEPWAPEPIAPVADEPHAPFPVAAAVGFVAVALAVGWLLIGRDVVVGAVALLVLLRFGRDPGRPLALGAFGLLVAAAVSTAVEGQGEAVNLAYATRRTVAAEAGAVMGAFLVVSTVIFAVTERSARRGTRPSGAGVDRIHLATLAAVLPAWVRAGVPYVAVAGGAVAVRLVGAPAALSAGYRPLLANLRLGTGYSLMAPSGGTPVGDLPPLAPVLVAYSPLGDRFALLAVSTLTVVGVGWVAHRRWGRAAGIAASAFAAVLPALWGEQLPIQLAGLLVLAGVGLADPAQATTRRAALAGAALGLAALARPDAAVALVVVAVWIGRSHRDGGVRVWALVAAATGVLLPWAQFVYRAFGSPWLASTLSATLNDPTAASRLPSTVKVALSAAFVAAFLAAATHLWGRRWTLLPFLALPGIGVALAFTEPLRRDPLAWSAPLAAVVLGRWAADGVRDLLGPVLEVRYRDVVDWDVVFEEQQRRRGRATGRPEGESPLEPEPEEDRLFL